MELRVGNKYRLGRKIGSGSFGDIFLGERPHEHELRRCVCSAYCPTPARAPPSPCGVRTGMQVRAMVGAHIR